MTGSHRIEAAKEAGIPVKVLRLEEDQLRELSSFLDEEGSIDFDGWMSLDDQGKSYWLKQAVRSGKAGLKDAATLMNREEWENNLASDLAKPLANEECRAENPATCRVHGTLAIREALLTGKLRKITPSEARDLLSEPVTVKNPTGVEFRFTKEKLLGDDSHLKADHSNADFHRRAKVMLYAVDAAKTSRDITNKSSTRPNDLGVYEQRKEVRKTFTDPDDKKKKFEVVVRADKNGEVFDAFDVFPR